MHVNLDRHEWPDMEILTLKEQICFQVRPCVRPRPSHTVALAFQVSAILQLVILQLPLYSARVESKLTR